MQQIHIGYTWEEIDSKDLRQAREYSRGDNGRVHIIHSRSNVTAVVELSQGCHHLIATSGVLNGKDISIKSINGLHSISKALSYIKRGVLASEAAMSLWLHSND